MDIKTFQPGPEHARERLDKFLTEQIPELSRARIQAVLRTGGGNINGSTAKASDILKAADIVEFMYPTLVVPPTAHPENIPLKFLHEDKDLLVLDKPAGIVVHPGAGNAGGTLVNALLHHCKDLSGIGGVERPGIVHRLDKETSGCLVIAKNDAAHQALCEQFAGREVQKVYLAAVAGVPRMRSGVINAAIGRHRVHRQKMTVCEPERGREAVTDYRVLESLEHISLVECTLHTGRTHQIRVHLKHLGYPVLGDAVYGKRGAFSRHMLHAWKLGFRHPVSGKEMRFESPPPAEFKALFPSLIQGKKRRTT